MKPVDRTLSVLLLCGALAVPASAQEPLQTVGKDLTLTTVKDLYAAAAYEDALAAVSQMQSGRLEPDLEQYRVFCLIALGRGDEARKAIENLIAANPLYLPDPSETSPRVQEAFTQTRQQLLPDLTRRLYVDAKATLDRKERTGAIEQFERLLHIIDNAGTSAPTFTDLRMLASGFLDLSRALPAGPPEVKPSPPPVSPTPPAPRSVAEARAAMSPPPAPASGSPAGNTPGPVAAGASASGPASPPEPSPLGAGAPRPTAIKQDLPPWFPSDPQSRQREFSGSVRVRIGADGRVQSANMIRPVHPAYDNELLRAARAWLYEPAKQDGVPVPVDLIVEVVLRPRD